MDKVVFSVYLGNPDNDNGTTLDLPAKPWELLDALERLRLREGQEPYWQVEDLGRYDFLEPHLDKCGLYQFNALAEQLSTFNEADAIAFEGLVQMESDKLEERILTWSVFVRSHPKWEQEMLESYIRQSGKEHVILAYLTYLAIGYFMDGKPLSDQMFDYLDRAWKQGWELDEICHLAMLKHLRDLGNSLIVVEHDEDTMLAADYIVDIGPGAGEHGGQVVAVGNAQEIMKNPNSVTGAYLSSGSDRKKEADRLSEGSRCTRE